MSSDGASVASRRILSRSRPDEDSSRHLNVVKSETQTKLIKNPSPVAQDHDVSLTLSSQQQQQQHNLAASYINKEPFNEDIEIEESGMINELKWRASVIERLKETIGELKGLKNETKASPQLSVVYRQGLLLCASIKKLNRVANMRVNKARNMTHEEKNKIDEFHLELQNLLYEISHLQAETNKCLEFRSSDEGISLVDLEAFYKSAPVEVSRPEVTRLAENVHMLKLARLDWELVERQQMLGRIKELESQIETRELELKGKQNKLESLNPKLNLILETCKPCLEYFSVNFDETAVFSELVQCLPKPLYQLYMMMSAHRDTVDKEVSIEVCGDLEEARRFDTNDKINLEDDESDSDNEENDTDYKQKKKSKAKSNKKNIREKLFKTFPLSCKLRIQIDSIGELTLEFFYLNYLKIVAVKIETTLQKDTASTDSAIIRPDNMFHCLYPKDTGAESPNLSNNYLFSNTGIKSIEQFMKPIGVPYKWAQTLCGLYYGSKLTTKSAVNEVEMMEENVSENESEEEDVGGEDVNESKMIVQILSRLKSRFRARVVLQKTINSTKNLNVSNPRLRIQSSLVSCRESSFEKFSSFGYTQHLLTEENLQINEADCNFYEIILINSAAKLQAQIAINQDYPSNAPLFAINIHWKQNERNFTNDEAIRDMERELNVYRENFLQDANVSSKRLRRSFSRVSNEERNYDLFSKQIGHLLVCFDVYLESESYYLQDNEYQRMKLFPQTVRGRDRKRPYSYLANKDMFVQRMELLAKDEQINSNKN